jgi:hypothetical protein
MVSHLHLEQLLTMLSLLVEGAAQESTILLPLVGAVITEHSTQH